jgi:lysophospholipase L1-like esterase
LPTQWRSYLNQVHPNVSVLLAGRWEVVDREFDGTWTNILNPRFAAYVKEQLEQASQILTSTGAHMVFLTTPCTNEGEQPDGASWPEDDPARLAVYNKLVQEVAAQHPKTDSVVNLNKIVCPGGTYTSTMNGVVVRRTDGVHFTTPGGELLAPKLMPPIVAAGRAQLGQTVAQVPAATR